jgi:cytochrome c-type biogenesis protein
LSVASGGGGLVEPAPLWRHPAFVGPLLAAGLLALLAPLWWGPASALLYELEFGVAERLPAGEISAGAGWLLPLAAFGFGVLASFSPCILPLVPLNVAAIGAADATGWQAVRRSGGFVLGAAAALAMLGLVGDLGGFLLIEQRGPVLLLAGVALIYFAGVALEVLPLPFAGRGPGAGARLGPVGAGAAFSLVATPCASPFVGALLAAASAQAVPGLATLSMVCFSLGYTAIVFLAGIFGGGVVQRLKRRSLEAPRAAAAALLLVAGASLVATGAAWF